MKSLGSKLIVSVLLGVFAGGCAVSSYEAPADEQNIVASKKPSRKSDAAVKKAIEKAAKGAIYTSEADVGYDYVFAQLGASDKKIDESLVRTRLAKYVGDGSDDAGADGPMNELFGETLPFDANAKCEEETDAYYKKLCAKEQILNNALRANLTDIHVFYFGSSGKPGQVDGTAVTIFIVGRTPNGNLAGVKTVAVWT